jgi:uncharacterized protein (UPF0276 family)
MQTIEGVGLQANPTIVSDIGLERFEGCPIDFLEVLVDTFVAPLDCRFLIDPMAGPVLERLAERYPLLAHSNYGAEFGFGPLDETPAVRRHVPFVRSIGSPFVADHMFTGSAASSHMWSSPLPFSRAEVVRVADRAAALQDRLGVPLLHEDAFFYAAAPGADLRAAEFMAGLVERAGTSLLLDLHNVHANDTNHESFSAADYLATIPLDRVLEIHIAGGQWLGGTYHDFHNAPVPEPVWSMLADLLPRTPNLRAVVLEVQGPAHHPLSRAVDESWVAMASGDLARASELWRAHRGDA